MGGASSRQAPLGFSYQLGELGVLYGVPPRQVEAGHRQDHGSSSFRERYFHNESTATGEEEENESGEQ